MQLENSVKNWPAVSSPIDLASDDNVATPSTTLTIFPSSSTRATFASLVLIVHVNEMYHNVRIS